MKKTFLTLSVTAAFFFVAALPAGLVFAQTVATPVFHTQTGVPVYNTQGTTIAPGIYYLADNAQIYYYGNSIYYNPTTQTYGSINDPSYVTSTYPYNTTSTVTTVVGTPNTGAGGNATSNWITLITLGMIVLASGAYLVYNSLPRQKIAVSKIAQ